MKNLQFWPNFQISSIMTKIWIIFKFDQISKIFIVKLNFQKSSILIKFSKIFNFNQNLNDLWFLPNFQISSILTKFSKIFNFGQFSNIFILTKIWTIFKFWQYFQKSSTIGWPITVLRSVIHTTSESPPLQFKDLRTLMGHPIIAYFFCNQAFVWINLLIMWVGWKKG